MIYLGNDNHKVLSVAINNCTVLGKPARLVSLIFPKLHAKPFLLRAFMVILRMFFLVFELWVRLIRSNKLIIREFSNYPLLIISPLIFPIRDYLYFNINHNFGGNNLLPNKILLILARIGFKFILFDGAELKEILPKSCIKSFYFPPFPCVSTCTLTKQNIKPIVAVVGDFRAEKGAVSILEASLKAITDSEIWIFKVGKYGNRQTLFEKVSAVEKVGTSTHEEYKFFMQSINVLIVFADKEKYFYRHSGTVMDAIANGVIPIVPNYPILSSQVNTPVPVGLTYDSTQDLHKLVTKALSMTEFFNENRSVYINKRRQIELLEQNI